MKYKKSFQFVCFGLALMIGLQNVRPMIVLADRADTMNVGVPSNPILFVENVGQYDSSLSESGGDSIGFRFQVLGNVHPTWLAGDSLWVSVLESEIAEGAEQGYDHFRPDRNGLGETAVHRHGVNLRLSFVDANPAPIIEPFNPVESRISYFWGDDPQNWHANVPVWGGVRYLNLYPGIDLEVSGEGGQLTQRLLVQDEADVNAVKLRIEGADRIALTEDKIQLETVDGPILLPLLQVSGVDTEKIPVPMISDNLIAAPFSKDPTSILIDGPEATSQDLLYSTFLGGTGDDIGYGIAVDPNGSAYVTGYTESVDFPTTTGAFDTLYHGGDVFVAKMNPSGTALSYATFLGGFCMDSGADITVDSSGAAYITGSTCSSNFPTTFGSFGPTYQGGMYGYDIFLSKLDPSGSTLLYSGILGGAMGDEGAYGVAVDSSGAAYITGWTSSSDFDVTSGAFDTTFNGGWSDSFVAKIDPAGANLSFSTYLGGSGDEDSQDLAVDATNKVYIVGETQSIDFPATSGAFDTILNGSYDAFVTKLDTAGSTLLYSTFLGGESWDAGRAIAVDVSGQVYVTGSAAPGFPITPGAYDPICVGGDAFVTKLTASGSKVSYSTCLGGSAGEYGDGIVVDATGIAYVAGWTHSSDFPVITNAYDTSINGSQDVFAVKINSTGSGLVYGTFLGGENTIGSDTDAGHGITLDTSGKLFITGGTSSPDFPVTSGVYDTSTNGSEDAFISRLAMTGSTPTYSVSGRVTHQGNGLYDVIISDGTGRMTKTVDGYFLLSGLAAGTYTLTLSSQGGFSFSPSSRTITLPFSATNLDFVTVQPPTGKTPIVFVHGWRGFPPQLTGCTDEKYQRVTTEEAKGYFQGVGDQLRVDGGYSDGEIFYAQLVSNTCYTPPLEDNVPNLMEAIDQAKSTTGKSKVILIAHSMGGLVARAYIESSRYRGDVEALFTFGSPHLGTPPAGLALLLNLPFLDGCEKYQPAVCDFSLNGMAIFNLKHHRNKTVNYHVISGDAPFLSRTPLGMEMAALLPGPDDGIVPTYSGRAALLGTFDRMTTDEVHGPGADGFGPNTYFVRDTGTSVSYSNCIKKVLLEGSSNCDKVGIAIADPEALANDLEKHTPIQQGFLMPGGSTILDISLEGGPSLFALQWSEGDLAFTLIDPDSNQINPIYASENPGIVTYTESNGSAVYYFPAAQAGHWQMVIEAGVVPTVGTTYHAFAAFNSTVTLTATLDSQWYAPGETAILTATLDGMPSSATVMATIARSDGISDYLALSSIGNGQYQANYHVPDVPGYAEVRISVNGMTAGNLQFDQETSLAFQISPDTFSLGSTYSENASLYPGLSLYQDLTISMEVNSIAGGALEVSADLVDGAGNFVAHGLTNQAVEPGTSWIDIQFEGGDIFSSRHDGPYTLTHVLLIDETAQALVAQEAQSVYVTAPYKYLDFIGPATFVDVPLNYWANQYIERLYLSGVTGGCSVTPLLYCPTTTVTRDQMAVFLLRGEHGSSYTPPSATGTMFVDVPQNYWAAAWIEQLAREGITGGCGGGKYCPNTVVTRDQMAVFLLRGKYGGNYTPPAVTGVFSDVPANYWAAAWIEQLAAEGITGGCGGGNYCPTIPVTRDQMAVFLVRAFSLP